MMAQSIFQNPPDSCRGTDFWMLNDRLDDNELVRQLEEMHAQGVASVIARTYIGLKSDYPGPDWMQKMHVVVDAAKRLGMTIFMQAGYMPEAVLDLPPEYVLKMVRAFPAGQGEGERLCTHSGLDYCLISSQNILDMLDPDASKFYVLQSYERMWAEFRSEFGKTITSVWVDEPSYGRADLPWTHGLPDAYRAIWGEEFPIDRVYLLFEDGDGAARLRYRYWRTVLHLITSSYFQSVRDWCNKNGVMFSGHLMGEDTMELQMRTTCFTMPCYKYFDLPGIDNLEAALDWQHGKIKPKKEKDFHWRHYGGYNTPIQCASACHQVGKTQILAEMYGVSTDNLNFRDQKAIFDHFASLGISHRSVHGLFYSLRGRGKRAYPPHVHHYQPYWPQYHRLTDTIARESAFLRHGLPVRDTLVLHPMDSAFCKYQATSSMPNRNAELQIYDAEFNETLRQLVSMQENFELGDEDSIALMGRADASGFTIGQMTYHTVVLPCCDNIRATTWSLLQQYMALGGPVVVLGRYPTMIDGEPTDFGDGWAAAKFAPDRGVLAEILDAQPHRYRIHGDDATHFQVYLMQGSDTAHYFVFNDDCAASHCGTLEIPGHVSAMAYHPEDGQIVPYATEFCGDATKIPLDLDAGSTIMLAVIASEKPHSVADVTETTRPLPLHWTAARHSPNVLVCEFFRFARENEPLSAGTYPILAIQEILSAEEYHGNLVLSYEFDTRISLYGLHLATESPGDQSFFLDGIPVAHDPDGWFCDKAFETIPLPNVAPGTHCIEIRRWFEPVKKAKMAVTSLFENLPGVELEPMMLLGDFAVRSLREPTIPGVVRMNSHFYLDSESLDGGLEWTSNGYPFYTGVLDLTATVALTASQVQAAPALRTSAVFAGCAEVLLDGKVQGAFTWAPYDVLLRDAHEGVNKITIRLYGTIRNLIGPWHRPQGEIGAAWGGYSAPNLPWLGLDQFDGTTDPAWYTHRVPDRAGWTESYLLLPLGISPMELVWRT